MHPINHHLRDLNPHELVLIEPREKSTYVPEQTVRYEFLDRDNPDIVVGELKFQSGHRNEVGVNGATHLAVLAVVRDQLKTFQEGANASREGAVALTKVEEAIFWLSERSRERHRRGVLGSHQK